jgi:hypothetical protein
VDPGKGEHRLAFWSSPTAAESMEISGGPRGVWSNSDTIRHGLRLRMGLWTRVHREAQNCLKDMEWSRTRITLLYHEWGYLTAEIPPFHSRSLKQPLKLTYQFKKKMSFCIQICKVLNEKSDLVGNLTLEVDPLCFFFLDGRIVLITYQESAM